MKTVVTNYHNILTATSKVCFTCELASASTFQRRVTRWLYSLWMRF